MCVCVCAGISNFFTAMFKFTAENIYARFEKFAKFALSSLIKYDIALSKRNNERQLNKN